MRRQPSSYETFLSVLERVVFGTLKIVGWMFAVTFIVFAKLVAPKRSSRRSLFRTKKKSKRMRDWGT